MAKHGNLLIQLAQPSWQLSLGTFCDKEQENWLCSHCLQLFSCTLVLPTCHEGWISWISKFPCFAIISSPNLWFWRRNSNKLAKEECKKTVANNTLVLPTCLNSFSKIKGLVMKWWQNMEICWFNLFSLHGNCLWEPFVTKNKQIGCVLVAWQPFSCSLHFANLFEFLL